MNDNVWISCKNASARRTERRKTIVQTQKASWASVYMNTVFVQMDAATANGERTRLGECMVRREVGKRI